MEERMSLLPLKANCLSTSLIKVLISKVTNEFLHVSVPLWFKNQRIVWLRQDCNLEPAAKHNFQSSAKQEAVCSYEYYAVLQKLFSNYF